MALENTLPDGWKLVEKKTCYALMNGNEVIANLARPDSEANAAILVEALRNKPEPPEPEWIDDPYDIEQGMIRNPKFSPKENAYKPVAWYTDDNLTDKSATTWDKAVADRWMTKGWPVNPLFAQASEASVGAVDTRKLAPIHPEPYGVILCEKNNPNAIETFIPQQFYLDAAWVWADSDYSKVPVYLHPAEQDDICPACGGSGEGGEVYVGEEGYEGPCHTCGGSGSTKPESNIGFATEEFERKYEYAFDLTRLPSGKYASKETADALARFIAGWNCGSTHVAKMKIDSWNRLASAMYQAAGEYNMPVRFLDVLDRAQENEPFDHLLNNLLPVSRNEAGVWTEQK